MRKLIEDSEQKKISFELNPDEINSPSENNNTASGEGIETHRELLLEYTRNLLQIILEKNNVDKLPPEIRYQSPTYTVYLFSNN